MFRFALSDSRIEISESLSEIQMRTFTAVIERDQDTGFFVGYVPGWSGAHSQGATLEELRQNLLEVIDMLLEDGEPSIDATFVGTQTLEVA
jgi:predicted RNase H-like HicB family nuclease